jgi:hypothetical protein
MIRLPKSKLESSFREASLRQSAKRTHHPRNPLSSATLTHHANGANATRTTREGGLKLVVGYRKDKDAWVEFQEANKVSYRSVENSAFTDPGYAAQTLTFVYMEKNEPFNELPWQYFPKPKINHYPPTFIYGFPLDDGVAGIEHLAHATGLLKSEETVPLHGLDSILARTLNYLEEECGLLREEFLSADGCYSKTARYVLVLKTNYNREHIAPKKLNHVAKVIGRYLPGKTPQRFLDPDIMDTKRRNFEISGSFLCQPLWFWLADPLPY